VNKVKSTAHAVMAVNAFSRNGRRNKTKAGLASVTEQAGMLPEEAYSQAPERTTLSLSGDDIVSWYEALPAHIAEANIAAITAVQEQKGANASPGPLIEKWYRKMEDEYADSLSLLAPGKRLCHHTTNMLTGEREVTEIEVTVNSEENGIDLVSGGFVSTIAFASIVSVDFIAEEHDFTHAYRVGTSSGVDVYLALSEPDLRQCAGAGQHASVTKEARAATMRYGLALQGAASFHRIPPFKTRAQLTLQSRQRTKKGLRGAIEKGQRLASGAKRRA